MSSGLVRDLHGRDLALGERRDAAWRCAGRHSASPPIAQQPANPVYPRERDRHRGRRNQQRAGAGSCVPFQARCQLVNLNERATVMSNKMWGGRFSAGPDIMAEINVSIDVDRKLFRQDIAGSKAHAKCSPAGGSFHGRMPSRSFTV